MKSTVYLWSIVALSVIVILFLIMRVVKLGNEISRISR